MSEISKGHRFLILRLGEIIPEVFYRRGDADAYFEENKGQVREYVEVFRKAKFLGIEVWSQERLYAAR